ncbi:MAG: glycosyl hydrolase, partial [Saprospiraceae bacterium]|nr:glycosyl hydrolase [Saprospiraceae bacterium]
MLRTLTSLLVLSLFSLTLSAQRTKDKEDAKPAESSLLSKTGMSGLKFRSIGPSITSGRISDFAVNPDNPKEYYVAVSSGGVWKTENAGNTYKPLFDGESCYSIGCVTLDPQNSNVVWVGSGENNNQRSVAYGDGVYKSEDGGSTWKNMGLTSSEHIGSIVVHPQNSDIVYVAAIGPLWNEGGERGVYKTVDGGENWELILEVDKHTGANEIVMDPRDPDVLYASMRQRRRHVFTYVGGGKGSGIYKTTDGGSSWQKVNKGLPSVDLGRIGLAISPANPEYLYAIVEAAQGKGGFYRSTNRGASWSKRGSYTSSGNYYQEIIADLKDPDVIYAMNTWMQVSTDGGKSFRPVGEDYKHVDNHCMWIDPLDGDHWLVGCDGGIYETWDAAKNWHFKANLPVTQFYKVAVDNAEPFYNIYGGTQDNFSLGGPSRTISGNGIANDEWFITHGGDGFESQVDPQDPNIIYAQSQYGVLVRYDKLSGEEVGIQPKPAEGEDAYRWNWDAPLEVSHHVPQRIYFAANKLFRSDDRGQSWKTLGGDLTGQIDRNALKVMGEVQSIDAVMKNSSTSPFGTIVAFSESPLDANLLVVGTDDGLLQISKDGGESWSRIEGIKGVPEMSYVNDVLASHHDEQVIYAVFNHHKYGDFRPYVVVSSDGGNTWKSIAANLPERGSVYTIEEDPQSADLLFVGTEFGVFFSLDMGMEWKRLKSGLPTIAVRDIAIQEREGDLVLGTFGRGFYVLDDYAPLSSLSEDLLATEGTLFSVRDAKIWEPAHPYGLPGKAFQGDSYYQGENMGPKALFRYYLKEKKETLADVRRKNEESYPSYEALVAEQEEEKAQLVFTIRDHEGGIVRVLNSGVKAGINQLTWDLRYAPKGPVSLNKSSFYNPFAGVRQGHAVAPGTYTVELEIEEGGVKKALGSPQTFRVVPLGNQSIPVQDVEAMVQFKQDISLLQGQVQATGRA